MVIKHSLQESACAIWNIKKTRATSQNLWMNVPEWKSLTGWGGGVVKPKSLLWGLWTIYDTFSPTEGL